MRGVSCPLRRRQTDQHHVTFNTYRMRFQLLTDRRAKRLAGCNVEASLVSGTLNRLPQHETIGKVRFFMGTPAIGSVEPAVNAIDRERCTAIVKAQDVFFVDIVGLAGDDPFTLIHHLSSPPVPGLPRVAQAAERIGSRSGTLRRMKYERSRV